MQPIDLRSDTVTLPSPAMRETMYRAEVGDDGYGEDPTVNRLQEIVADRVGMEASLFMPSGIMANMAALLIHCQRGSEAIMGRLTDMYLWECGGYSAMGGIHPWPIDNKPDGTLDLGEVEAAIRLEDIHFPRTQLICIENSANICGGVPLSPRYISSLIALANKYRVPVHVDGARIFNSAVAQGVDVKELTKGAASLMFCLSKGLGCPVGSMLCGSKGFIAEAHRVRKMLGGQMRQAGIVAAAGIVAMEQMVDRLADDHRNIRIFADGLRGIAGLTTKPQEPQTNMLYFRIPWDRVSVQDLETKLNDAGARVLRMGDWLRAVTHYGIEEEDVRAAAAIVRNVIGSL